MIPRPEQPIRPGLSISQKGFGLANGGTLGCFMIDNKTGGVVLVSNQHVLAFFEAPFYSFFGAEKEAQFAVVQPHACDINSYIASDCDSTAKIATAYNQLGIFSQFAINEGDTLKTLQDRLTEQLAKRCTVARYDRGQLKDGLDIAVAPLVSGVQWANKFPDDFTMRPPPPDASGLAVGMAVRKWGARSGAWKTGKITKLNVTTEVSFGNTSQNSTPMPKSPTPVVHNKLSLTGLIEVDGDALNDTFQMQGDSGSSLCLADGTLIGILSSGGLGRRAYACPIWPAMATFGLSFP